MLIYLYKQLYYYNINTNYISVNFIVNKTRKYPQNTSPVYLYICIFVRYPNPAKSVCSDAGSGSVGMHAQAHAHIRTSTCTYNPTRLRLYDLMRVII